MGLPDITPVDEAPAPEPAAPQPEAHEGCPFFNNGKCLVLNEDVRDLGKEDAAEYDDSQEEEFSEL
jgi:hypothetical protein